MMNCSSSTPTVPSGTILLWSGAVVDIPAGFSLCDGNNGTPDLRDKFIVGAGDTYNPADTGGTSSHSHSGETQHKHQLIAMGYIGAGPDYDVTTGFPENVGSTGDAGTLPPYFALAYIMKD